MDKRLEKSTYSLTVEGECEKLYFEHLRELINECQNKKKQCVFKPDIKVKANPLSFARRFSNLSIPFFHIQDIEDYDDVFQRDKFQHLLLDIKSAKKLVNYKLGYTNFSFDLWMCLHKIDVKVSRGHRKEYLHDINRAFNTKYQYIDEYKRENDFKSILNTISLDDIKKAIKRAKQIRNINEQGLSNIPGQKKIEYCGFEYYCKNPDLNIQEVVEKILNECLV